MSTEVLEHILNPDNYLPAVVLKLMVFFFYRSISNVIA
jgi:hypothetical protein